MRLPGNADHANDGKALKIYCLKYFLSFLTQKQSAIILATREVHVNEKKQHEKKQKGRMDADELGQKLNS